MIYSVVNDEIGNTLEEQIKSLNQGKLNNIELRKIDGQYLFELDINLLVGYQNILKIKDIKVSLIDSPIGKGKYDFNKEHELIKKYIEICHIFNCQYLRIFTDVGNNIIDTLNEYNLLALKNDITLLIENEKNTYGEKSINNYNLMQQGYSNIKLLFDVENYYASNEDYIEAFIKLKPYIRYIHIRDYSNTKKSYVYLKDGDIDIDKILSLSNDITVSLETHLPMCYKEEKEKLFVNSIRRLVNYE